MSCSHGGLNLELIKMFKFYLRADETVRVSYEKHASAPDI